MRRWDVKKWQDLDALRGGRGLVKKDVQKGPSWSFSSESLEMSPVGEVA